MKTAGTDDQALNVLIDYISSRGLAAGQRLPPIKDLAGELRLAPHSVRDVLLQAQTLGLVRVQPRSGCYVQSVNFAPLVEVFARSLPRALAQQDRNLFDLLEARRLIEVELAALAARRRRMADLVPLRTALHAMYDTPDYAAYMAANEDFHVGIARIGGNAVLQAVVQSLLTLLRPTLGAHQPRNWRDEGSVKRQRDAREHEAVFQALLAGDGAAARAAMTEHLRDTTESLLPRPTDSATVGYTTEVSA